MTKKSRTILFLTFFFFFVVIAPSAVLYSQGYRVDMENKKITQTGGFFFRVTPRQADIYLDGKLKKRTDFFFGSVLIENLIPKKYKIEIKKEGYHSWEKTLEIKERHVTETKNLILFPGEISFNVLFDEIEHFWFYPDQNRMILKTKSEEENSDWSLYVYDLEEKTKNHLLDEKDVSIKKTSLTGLSFSEDFKKIYLQTETEGQTKYFILQESDKTVIEEEESFVGYKEAEIENFRKNEEFEDFFENTDYLKLSPDKKKLAYFSDYEVWIIYQEEKRFLIRLSEKINDLFWLNDDYLIFIAGNIIKISELDDRDKLNIIDFFELKKLPQSGSSIIMFWNQFDKKIYLLSDKNLYASDVILP